MTPAYKARRKIRQATLRKLQPLVQHFSVSKLLDVQMSTAKREANALNTPREVVCTDS